MSLDFESQDFDPLVALAAPDIELPYEDVQPLNNLSEYYNVTKGGSTATKRQLSTKKSHNLAQVFVNENDDIQFIMYKAYSILD